MSIKNNPLLEEYKAELAKVWGTDERMIDYCIRTTQSLIKLSTGQLFATTLPEIEKEFCFGYSSCGQGPSFEECQQNHDDFLKHKEEYFYKKNLRSFDSYIDQLSTDHYRKPYLISEYHSDAKANIAVVSWIGDFDFDCGHIRRDECTPLSDTDKEAIKSVYLSDKKAMMKRLETYLKKYGTSKLRSWTYWIDE